MNYDKMRTGVVVRKRRRGPETPTAQTKGGGKGVRKRHRSSTNRRECMELHICGGNTPADVMMVESWFSHSIRWIEDNVTVGNAVKISCGLVREQAIGSVAYTTSRHPFYVHLGHTASIQLHSEIDDSWKSQHPLTTIAEMRTLNRGELVCIEGRVVNKTTGTAAMVAGGEQREVVDLQMRIGDDMIQLSGWECLAEKAAKLDLGAAYRIEAVRVVHARGGGVRLVFHYLTQVRELNDGLPRTPATAVAARKVSTEQRRQRQSHRHEEVPFYTLSLVSTLCSPEYGFSAAELVQVHGVYMELSQAGIVYQGCHGCHMAACDGVKACQCAADVGLLWKAKVVLTDHTAQVHATMFEAFGELMELYKDRLTDGNSLQPACDADQEACQLMRLVGATPLSILLQFVRWQRTEGLSVIVRQIIPTVDIRAMTTHHPMTALPRFDGLEHSRLPIATLAQTGQSAPFRI